MRLSLHLPVAMQAWSIAQVPFQGTHFVHEGHGEGCPAPGPCPAQAHCDRDCGYALLIHAHAHALVRGWCG